MIGKRAASFQKQEKLFRVLVFSIYKILTIIEELSQSYQATECVHQNNYIKLKNLIKKRF